MRTLSTRVLLIGAVGTAPACIDIGPYACLDDAQCRVDGIDGRCEAQGHCSYPDEGCDSGFRFSQNASGELAGVCVAADDGTAPPATTTTGPGSGSTGGFPPDVATDTGADTTGGTGTPNVCGDGEISPDEGCDDGNERDGDGCNRDCLPSGRSLWTQTYNGPAADADRANAVNVASDGTLVVAGMITSLRSEDILVRKYDGQGTALLTSFVDTSAKLVDRGNAVAIDSAGNVLAAGFRTFDTRQRLWVRKYGSTLETFWTRDVGSEMQVGEAHAVGVTGDGDVIVAGALGAPGDTNIWIRRYGLDATVRWTKTVPGPAGKDDQGLGIDVAPDGAFAVVGAMAADEGAVHAYVATYDGDGNEVTSFVREPAQDDTSLWARDVAALSDGTLVVVGSTQGDGADIWVAKFDPDGTVLWEDTQTGPGQEDDSAFSVAADPMGDLVVAGTLSEAGATDGWLRRYDSDGTPLWTLTHDGPGQGDDGFRGVDLDPDGNIVVAGYETAVSGTTDAWIGKYTP